MKNVAVMDYSDAVIKLGKMTDLNLADDELKQTLEREFGYKESECEYMTSDKPIKVQWANWNYPLSRKAVKILKNCLAITLTAQAEIASDRLDNDLVAVLKWVSGIYEHILVNRR